MVSKQEYRPKSSSDFRKEKDIENENITTDNTVIDRRKKFMEQIHGSKQGGDFHSRGTWIALLSYSISDCELDIVLRCFNHRRAFPCREAFYIVRRRGTFVVTRLVLSHVPL